MACMYPLIFLRQQQQGGEYDTTTIVAWTVVLLACLGRVYWFAHHVGDVLVGVTTSLVACWIFHQIVRDDNDNRIVHVYWWTPLLTHGLLLSIVILTRWLTKNEVLSSGTIRVVASLVQK